MKKATLKEFENGIKEMLKYPDGCVYFKVGKTPEEKDGAVVLGFVRGYDEGDKYQIKIDNEVYTLCGKVAVNIDDLQCDYDFDWYMPWGGDGDVYDTETTIGELEWSYNWLFGEAEYVLAELKDKVLTVEK